MGTFPDQRGLQNHFLTAVAKVAAQSLGGHVVWAKGIVLAILLLLVVSPALAAIDRFTDDKGTLHITNTSEEKTRLEERDEDSSAPPQRLPQKPAIVQPPPETEQTESGGADKEKPKPSSNLTVPRGLMHVANVESKLGDPAKTHSAPTPSPGATA